MRRRWSHFDKLAREATGQDLRTLILEFSTRNGPVTAQQVSSHISQLVGEVYSPEAARYGCEKYGVSLEKKERRFCPRHRGRHQRIIAEHIDPDRRDFALAIYHLTRQHNRHDLHKLAHRLAWRNNLSFDQVTCLARCLLDACALERWLTIGGHFVGSGRLLHMREQEAQRAGCAMEYATVVGFEGQGPGLLALFRDGDGLVMRRDKDGTVYMRLETPDSHSAIPDTTGVTSCMIRLGNPPTGLGSP